MSRPKYASPRICLTNICLAPQVATELALISQTKSDEIVALKGQLNGTTTEVAALKVQLYKATEASASSADAAELTEKLLAAEGMAQVRCS